MPNGEELDEALASLRQAEALLPDSPDAPYAAATIHLRQGDLPAARDVALRTLGVAPDYHPARRLLAELGP